MFLPAVLGQIVSTRPRRPQPAAEPAPRSSIHVTTTHADMSAISSELHAMAVPATAAERAGIAAYLDAQHGRRYLLFNLGSASAEESFGPQAAERCVDLGWATCGAINAPTLAHVWRVAHALRAWLALDETHVAIVACANGRSRTGIAIACYLRFCGATASAVEGFRLFCHRRGVGAATAAATLDGLPPSLHALLRNVDATVEDRQYANSDPLQLVAIIVRGVPVEDLPCVDLHDASGRRCVAACAAAAPLSHRHPPAPALALTLRLLSYPPLLPSSQVRLQRRRRRRDGVGRGRRAGLLPGQRDSKFRGRRRAQPAPRSRPPPPP